MITKRIIPCLDVKDGRVVKGVNFLGLSDVSSPIDLARFYSDGGADELVSVSYTHLDVYKRQLYGPFEKITEELEQLSINEKTDSAINELKGVYEILKLYGCEKNINIDFSIINDMNYYNGIVFKGYVAGIPSNILSGGRYDNLVHKFGKKAGAIGLSLIHI